jgi:peptidoglycan hydrolase CwlO-like protein
LVNLFDNNLNTLWGSEGTSSPQWIQLEFQNPQNIIKYTLGARYNPPGSGNVYRPKSWVFSVSNDGHTFTNVHAIGEYNSPEVWNKSIEATFNLTNNEGNTLQQPWKYVRLSIISAFNNSSYIVVDLSKFDVGTNYHPPPVHPPRPPSHPQPPAQPQPQPPAHPPPANGSWVKRNAHFKFIDMYGKTAVALKSDGSLYYTDNIGVHPWSKKGGSYKFKHVSIFGSQCVGVRTNNELVRSRNIKTQGFGHVTNRGYVFNKVFLCGNPANPNKAIGIRNNGEVVKTDDLNHAYWGHMPGNPKFVNLDVYGVGVAGISQDGTTYYSGNYTYGGWTQSPGLGSASMKFKHIQLYGVSACGINFSNELYVTDDITKGQWRKIPVPAGGLRMVTMYSHSIVGLDTKAGTEGYVQISSKPNLGKIIQDLMAKIQQLNGTVDQLRNTINQRDATIKQLQNQVKEYEADIEALDEQIDQQIGDIAALKQQRDALIANVNNLLGQIQGLQKEIERLKAEIAGKDVIIATLTAELNLFKKENEALKQEVKQLQEDKEELQQDLAESQVEIANLNNTIDGLEATVDTLEAQIAAQQGDIESLQEQLATANQEIIRLKGLVQQKNQQIATLEQSIIAKDNEIAALGQEVDYWKGQYDDATTRCPKIPHGHVVADKNTGVMYKVTQGEQGTTLHPFPTVAVYEAYGSPTYTVYESYQLQNCAQGPPVKIEDANPEPMVPSYLPPANLHPPSMVLIISASLWMKNQTLKAIHLSKNNARPFLGSKLNNDSVFNVGPKTGEIKSLSGKVLQLTTTSKQKETGWNFIPYTLRDLGNGIAFQLQQYNKKLAVIPGVDVTTLHSADSYSLDSVWFVLGV